MAYEWSPGLDMGTAVGGDFDPNKVHVVHTTWLEDVTYPVCKCGFMGVHSLWEHWVRRWTGGDFHRLRDLFYRTTWGESDQ